MREKCNRILRFPSVAEEPFFGVSADLEKVYKLAMAQWESVASKCHEESPLTK